MKNIITIALVIFLLVSCGTPKRNFNTPDLGLHLDENYLTVDGKTSFDNSQPIAEWWQLFNDPTLDSLIAKARTNNLDINSAVANLYAARAVLKGTKLDRLPTVTANGNFVRQRLGENVFAEGSNPTFSQYNGSFDAFWELDLFGRVTNRLKGAKSYEQSALAEMNSVYVSIFAEVARNYMELRGAQYLLDIAERNLKNQQETYDLTVRLSNAGTTNSLDVARALAQLKTTQASIPSIQARIESIKNSLSILIGEVPGNLTDNVVDNKPLPDLPASVLVGNVEDLLRRRPDIMRAENELAQRIAQYNISVAELYPKISFNGAIGFSAIDFSNLGKNQSFTWNLAPQISWAAFNLGRVRQQIRQQDALTIKALNQYEKVVLQALEEIRTAMSNYTNELNRRELLGKASEASNDAAAFSEQRFKAGLDSFLDYLSADRTLLRTEIELAQSETTAVTGLIAIYKALGGGWEIIGDGEMEIKYNQMRSTDTSMNR